MTLAQRLAHKAVGFEGSPVLEEIVAEAINAALEQVVIIAREGADAAIREQSGRLDGECCVSWLEHIIGAVEALKTKEIADASA